VAVVLVAAVVVALVQPALKTEELDRRDFMALSENIVKNLENKAIEVRKKIEDSK